MGMRIITRPPGGGGDASVSSIVEPIQRAEADGFQSAWMGIT